MKMKQKITKVLKQKVMTMKLQVKDLIVNVKKKVLKKISKKGKKLKLTNGVPFIMIYLTEQET